MKQDFFIVLFLLLVIRIIHHYSYVTLKKKLNIVCLLLLIALSLFSLFNIGVIETVIIFLLMVFVLNPLIGIVSRIIEMRLNATNREKYEQVGKIFGISAEEVRQRTMENNITSKKQQ